MDILAAWQDTIFGPRHLIAVMVMVAKKNDTKKSDKETTPRDAQKGGQGAIGKDDPHAELDQRGHPGSGSKES
jgi:hypothetical protein